MAPLIASVLGVCTIRDISFCLSLRVRWQIAKHSLIVLSAHVSHFTKSGESLCLALLPCGSSPIPSCPPCFSTGHLSTPPPHDQGVTGGGNADDQRIRALRFGQQCEMLKQLLRHLPPKYFSLIQFALGLTSASMEGAGRGFRGNRARARPGEGQGLRRLLGLRFGICDPDETRLQWHYQSLLFKNKGGKTTGPVWGRRGNTGWSREGAGPGGGVFGLKYQFRN